jgi:glutathione S-transferase
MSSSQQQDPWRLYYWPGVKGRGEYVRLVLEEAGANYVDVGHLGSARPASAGHGGDWANVSSSAGFQEVVRFVFRKGGDGGGGEGSGGGGGGSGQQQQQQQQQQQEHTPVRAPPVLARGRFAVCNTPAILSYLNKALGWADGLTLEQQATVDAALAVVLGDAVGEGRLAFHPVAFYKSHKVQVQESVPYREEYGAQRLPKYYAYLEALLEWNEREQAAAAAGGDGGSGSGNDGGAAGGSGEDSGGGYLVGGRLTVADVAAAHYVAACERHYPDHHAAAAAGAPRLMALRARVMARPRIAAYLVSDRCPPFDDDSLM